MTRKEYKKLREKLLRIFRKNNIKYDKATHSYWLTGIIAVHYYSEIDLGDLIYDILNAIKPTYE